MNPLVLYNFVPLPDCDTFTTKFLNKILQDAVSGKLRPEDFTEDIWKETSPNQTLLKTFYEKLGSIISTNLIERNNENDQNSYYYVVIFNNGRILFHLHLNKQRKVSYAQVELEEVNEKI